MSLCWNIFSKVPWSCWYCECYLNDSFEFLRTTQLRKKVFCFSVIFIWKFLVWGAKKKDAEQQIALEQSHTIAAVFQFTGWSQTQASGTVSPDMHRVNLDYLWCFCKGPFTKKLWDISGFDHNVKDSYQTLLLIWCLFLGCCCIFHKSQSFDWTFHADIGFAHLCVPAWWNSSSSEVKVFLKYILYYNTVHINIYKYLLAYEEGQVLCHIRHRDPEAAKSIFWREDLLFCWSRQT